MLLGCWLLGSEVKIQGLDLSKRRESEIGREWRGGEAVYETEGVGSRQWRVDSGREAYPVTRADRQCPVLNGEADSPRSGATGERGAGREPRRLSGSLPGGVAGAQAPHETDRFLVIEGGRRGSFSPTASPGSLRTPPPLGWTPVVGAGLTPPRPSRAKPTVVALELPLPLNAARANRV